MIAGMLFVEEIGYTIINVIPLSRVRVLMKKDKHFNLRKSLF